MNATVSRTKLFRSMTKKGKNASLEDGLLPEIFMFNSFSLSRDLFIGIPDDRSKPLVISLPKSDRTYNLKWRKLAYISLLDIDI